MKVLLDTDIGSDIDDALALAYLLRKPECELLGIATGTGDTRKRLDLATWLCDAAGMADIPVRAGLEGPLLTGPGQPNVPQHAAFRGRPSEAKGGWEAIEFLRTTIRSHPGEITLMAIGPMTNIGALFLADPEIPAMLQRVVLMCGTFGVTEDGRRHPSEWNARCDPVASAIVFKRAAPGTLTSVGLDVTMACRIPAEQLHARLQGEDEVLNAVDAMSRIWTKGNPEVTFHDPLAAALLFEPELCELACGQAEVELEAGVTAWRPSPDGPHQIGVSVRPQAFFEEYFETVMRR